MTNVNAKFTTRCWIGCLVLVVKTTVLVSSQQLRNQMGKHMLHTKGSTIILLCQTTTHLQVHEIKWKTSFVQIQLQAQQHLQWVINSYLSQQTSMKPGVMLIESETSVRSFSKQKACALPLEQTCSGFWNLTWNILYWTIIHVCLPKMSQTLLPCNLPTCVKCFKKQQLVFKVIQLRESYVILTIMPLRLTYTSPQVMIESQTAGYLF